MIKKIIEKIGTLLGVEGVAEIGRVLGLQKGTAYDLNQNRAGKYLQAAYEQIYALLIQNPAKAKEIFFQPPKPSADSREAQEDMKSYLLRQIKQNQDLKALCISNFVESSIKLIQLEAKNTMLKNELQALKKVKPSNP